MTKFDKNSTADDVLEGLDLSDMRVLITGTSAGLGIETARALASKGASIVGTARNLAKAQEAIKAVIEEAANGGGIELVELDLASLDSVRACADALLAEGKQFDVVIANAGVMACPESRTEDGFEMQFGTNHLGHFLLVNRIISLIKPGGRFVSLSSVGHRLNDVDLEDPNFEKKPYGAFAAYGSSKTATALCAVEFDRRHKDRGIHAAAVHPGAIHETELARHMSPEAIAEAAALGSGPVETKNIPQGAATTVWAGFVADAQAIGGKYCEDCHIAEINDDTEPFSGVRSYALDPERAKALWLKSEELVEETF